MTHTLSILRSQLRCNLPRGNGPEFLISDGSLLQPSPCFPPPHLLCYLQGPIKLFSTILGSITISEPMKEQANVIFLEAISIKWFSIWLSRNLRFIKSFSDILFDSGLTVHSHTHKKKKTKKWVRRLPSFPSVHLLKHKHLPCGFKSPHVRRAGRSPWRMPCCFCSCPDGPSNSSRKNTVNFPAHPDSPSTLPSVALSLLE